MFDYIIIERESNRIIYSPKILFFTENEAWVHAINMSYKLNCGDKMYRIKLLKIQDEES